MAFSEFVRNWRKVPAPQAQKVEGPNEGSIAYLSDAERARISRYANYRDFYLGNHFGYDREKGEHLVTMNYCGPMVDKSVAFLVGKSFEVSVPKRLAKVTFDVLKGTWEKNAKDLLAVQLAQSGSIHGDCYLKIVFDDEKRIVKILVLDPSVVFPEVDPRDFTKMKSVRIMYKVDGKMLTEKITATQIQEFVDDTEILEKRRPNSLGEIPLIHIPNIPMPNCFFGRSDLEELCKLNKELNEKLTDVSDIINYHSAPVTLIFGATAKQLEKGPRKVWSGLPKDADVRNLELQSDLGAATKYIEMVKTAMHEVGQIPEGSLGKQQAISNTSGVALHIQYQPLMEKTRVKRLTYGQGIKEANRLILKTYEVYMGFKFPGVNAYESEVKFGDPLPKDELIERQIIGQELGFGITSKQDAMRRLGRSEEEIEDLIEEIDADAMKQAQFEYGAAADASGDVPGLNAGLDNGPQGA